jgi:beta-glucan synthesis-associated protein KRE6
MSDEFEKEGRNFADGQDPKWTAINKNDYTNAALHYYSKDLVTTSGGKLNITTVNEDVTFRYWEDKKKGWSKMSKTYKSGMLQVSTA